MTIKGGSFLFFQINSIIEYKNYRVVFDTTNFEYVGPGFYTRIFTKEQKPKPLLIHVNELIEDLYLSALDDEIKQITKELKIN